MLRIDPPGDGTPSAYADSDVGSSPRSIGARAGSLTEDPPASVKWDDAALTRVKLMCSYGGRILPRPHDNQLRYVGGESRIVVVSHSVTFGELTTKLSRMFGASVVVKYQLPNEDLDALISVTSDEDLENMMEEYDRLQSSGNRAASSPRLRLFLFPLKLERSQTSSLIEMLENNHSRERMFVDILNSMPVLSHMRSETSSIMSETPDYLLQGNIDALEEWAAATSYGNSSVPPHVELSPDNKQPNPLPAAATLFGSLLQHSGSGEVLSAPGSPSPIKAKPFMMGSSSSAPPAVISLLSAMVEAVSKGQPTPSQQVLSDADMSAGALRIRTRLGSGDGSGRSVPEQKKHVDSEILLTSDKGDSEILLTSEKGILTSSVGAAEQLLLPAGLMDDDDVMQKLSAKGSFDEVSESSNPQNVVFDARVHHVVAAPSRVVGELKGDSEAEALLLTGQPIFDEEAPPAHTLGKNLKMLQREEVAPSSPITSPSAGVSSTFAQISPNIVAPQGPVPVVGIPKFVPDDRSKHQIFPLSPRAIGHIGREDKAVQQVLTSANVVVSKPGGEDGLVQQGSPSLAHFLSPLEIPSMRAGDDALTTRQSPAISMTKDIVAPETTLQVQTPLIRPSVPLVRPALHEQPMMQKLSPASNYLYQFQQSEEQFPEAGISAINYATQALGIQPLIMSQTPSSVTSVAAMPPSVAAAPLKPAMVAPGLNTAPATRPVAGPSRPQSPHAIVTGAGTFQHPVPQLPQIRTTNPPPVMATNVSPFTVLSSMGEAMKVISPTFSNVSPTTVFSSMGEAGKGIPSTPYQQVEVAHLHRQVSDPLHSQKAVAMSPQNSTQFTTANLNVPSTPGVPSRFRAVGLPVQQVAEGIPLQQSPGAIGGISDKKIPVLVQRPLPVPPLRQPLAPATQYGYYMEQPSTHPLPTVMGGVPRYTSPPNVLMGGVVTSPDTIPFVGANPFVDNFRPVSAYQDVLEVPPKDQQRRQMRS